MQNELAEILIKNKLLKVDMEVDAIYESTTLDGTTKVLASGIFMIQSIQEDKEIIFKVISTHDGHNRFIKVDDISKIDGMDPERFALVYNIQSDGSKVKVGKRRGRKPKDR